MAGIKFDNISFAYGDRQILKNFSLEVDDSQIMCLVGPSGCGKTTLIRCLLGFNKPSSGEIWIGDRCVFSQTRRINVPPERRNVGVVFQDYAVWPHMTVMENVCYPMKKRKMPREEIRKRAENALKQVRMSEYASYLPSQLSGGQQQRVAIARALVSSDEVIVMDEPITNLDAKLRAEMLIEIRQIQKNIGTTIFYITHDQEASLQLCDRMAIMNASGELCQLGADEDIILHPANRFVFYDGEVPTGYERMGMADMGVRPNNIVFDPQSPVKARVKRAVFLGSEYDYFVDFNGKEVRVQKNAFDALKEGRIEKEGEIVGLRFLNPEFYLPKDSADTALNERKEASV